MRTKYYIMESVRTWGEGGSPRVQFASNRRSVYVKLFSTFKEPLNSTTRATGRDDHVIVQILFLFLEYI